MNFLEQCISRLPTSNLTNDCAERVGFAERRTASRVTGRVDNPSERRTQVDENTRRLWGSAHRDVDFNLKVFVLYESSSYLRYRHFQ